MSQIQPVPGPSQDAFNAVVDQIGTLNDKIAKYALPQTKNVTKSFSGSGVSTYSLILSSDAMVTLSVYNNAGMSVYTPSGANEAVVCSAYAPGISQCSFANSVYLKAGTYTVYYWGNGSSSSGAVITWS